MNEGDKIVFTMPDGSRVETTVCFVSGARRSNQEWCDRCDGCGWYEGGKTLQTKCEKCNGTGVLGAP